MVEASVAGSVTGIVRREFQDNCMKTLDTALVIGWLAAYGLNWLHRRWFLRDRESQEFCSSRWGVCLGFVYLLLTPVAVLGLAGVLSLEPFALAVMGIAMLGAVGEMVWRHYRYRRAANG